MNDRYTVEYDILISKVHRWGEIIRFGGELPLEDVHEDVISFLDLLNEDRDRCISLVFSSKHSSEIQTHEIEAVNIAILSLAVGIDLNLDEDSLKKLGVAAILKDLGMNRIPAEIINKTEELTEDEIAEIKRHPEYSVEIIKSFGFSDDIADIVIDHQERWDGKGYPRGKNGESINYLARILSVLDGFNAMRQDRPHRESVDGYDAIKSLLSDNGLRYDPAILKAVIKGIGIYPIGSYVALNDSSICRVVATNPKKPLKPIVEVIINKDGSESRSRNIIDISDNNRFFIVRTVEV